MNTITAYAPIVDFQHIGGQYQVIDAAQSLGKKRPVIVGYASIIKGFVHYVGDRYGTHKDVTAVIRPEYRTETGELMSGDPLGALAAALGSGLKSGRDDRK